MHTFDPAIFDTGDTTLEELLQAVRMQPSQAWRLYTSPVFMLSALRGQLGDLHERLGNAIMTELATQHGGDVSRMGNVSAVLTRGNLLAACSVAHQVPARSMVTDALAALGKADTLIQLGACLGLLSQHPEWRSDDWNAACQTSATGRLNTGEFTQAAEHLRDLAHEGQTFITGREDALYDEEAGFLAVTTRDIRLISVLSLHDRAAVMLEYNRQCPPALLASLALFGPPLVRALMAARLQREGHDPVRLLNEAAPDRQITPEAPRSAATDTATAGHKTPRRSGEVVPISQLL